MIHRNKKAKPAKTVDNQFKYNYNHSYNTPEQNQQNEAIAVAESQSYSHQTPEGIKSNDMKKSKKRNNLIFNHFTKKQFTGIVLSGLLMAAILGGVVWMLFFNKQEAAAPAAIEQPPAEPVVEKIYSPLTGLEVSEAQANNPVTAVMIENSPEARPQTGLQQADLVFEAIAEAGITRFVALYQESNPEVIGPIRSVRPYYLDWLVPFQAPIAHVGGSPEALAQVTAQNLRTLNQFIHSGAYYRSSARFAPHNMYSGRPALLEVHKAQGYDKSEFEPWERKDEKPLQTPKAISIDLAISSYLYNPVFNYDKESNSYLRSMNNRSHIDERSGDQINPKVVIAMVVPRRVHPNGVHTIYDTHGSGTAKIFQNGDVISVRWEKADRSSMIKFTDTEGKEVELVRGKTWVTVVDNAGAILYTAPEPPAQAPAN
jgi:hypothetical protein